MAGFEEKNLVEENIAPTFETGGDNDLVKLQEAIRLEIKNRESDIAKKVENGEAVPESSMIDLELDNSLQEKLGAILDKETHGYGLGLTTGLFLLAIIDILRVNGGALDWSVSVAPVAAGLGFITLGNALRENDNIKSAEN
jgi:hypothetical protein